MDLDGRDDVSGFAFFSPSAPGTHSCGACTVPAEHVFPLLDFTEALQLSSLSLHFAASPLPPQKIEKENEAITFRVKLLPEHVVV